MITDYSNPNIYLNDKQPFSLNNEYVDLYSDTSS